MARVVLCIAWNFEAPAQHQPCGFRERPGATLAVLGAPSARVAAGGFIYCGAGSRRKRSRPDGREPVTDSGGRRQPDVLFSGRIAADTATPGRAIELVDDVGAAVLVSLLGEPHVALRQVRPLRPQ